MLYLRHIPFLGIYITEVGDKLSSIIGTYLVLEQIGKGASRREMRKSWLIPRTRRYLSGERGDTETITLRSEGKVGKGSSHDTTRADARQV